MITPSELSMLEGLAEGAPERLRGTIDPERGQVVYPEAEDLLATDAVATTLTAFADRGLLEPAAERDCTVVMSDPHETVELSLRQYTLSARGERWVRSQRGAIDAASDLLQQRGYTVRTDTVLTGSSGERYPVHIHAEDELVGTELVVGLAPDSEATDVVRLRTIADDTDSSPVLLTTSDPSEELRTLARNRRVNVLRVDEGGGEVEDEGLAAPEGND